MVFWRWAVPVGLSVVASVFLGCGRSRSIPGRGNDTSRADAGSAAGPGAEATVGGVPAAGSVAAVPRGSGDADASVEEGCDGWLDPASGLCWQDPPPEGRYTWQEAIDYCAHLSLGGHGAGQWRLPTVTELRSLIRGCAATQAGGTCRVGDGCLDAACASSGCERCGTLHGPGEQGCYWPQGLRGTCGSPWSSSSYAGVSSFAWSVGFNDGFVAIADKAAATYVRCVRRGP